MLDCTYRFTRILKGCNYGAPMKTNMMLRDSLSPQLIANQGLLILISHPASSEATLSTGEEKVLVSLLTCNDECCRWAMKHSTVWYKDSSKDNSKAINKRNVIFVSPR